MQQGLAYEISAVMAQARGTGLMISVATFQDESGVPVTGLINIQCQDAPLNTGDRSFSVDEIKSQPQILSQGERHVLLNGYYPAAAAVWRNGGNVVIDSLTYDILGVESDSQETQTRVKAGNATI